jgi:hypothetical protein
VPGRVVSGEVYGVLALGLGEREIVGFL